MADFLSIKKIEKEGERKVLQTLWKLYVESLSEYANFPKSAAEIAEEEAKEHERRTDHLIFLSGIPIGFIITGAWPNAFAKHDLYIQEFFIKKEYRRSGFGKAALRKILANSKKDISLFIFRENIPALQFWSKTLEKLGYIDRIADIQANCNTNDDMYFKYYLKVSSD